MQKLNIMGNVYTIKLVDVEVSDYYGQISPAMSEIRIAKHLSIEAKFQTLIHEMIHGIAGHSGFFKDDKTEEKFATLFGNLIGDTLLRSGVVTTKQIQEYFDGNFVKKSPILCTATKLRGEKK